MKVVIDSSKLSLKAVFSHIGNKNLTIIYDNMKVLLSKIEYLRYWNVRGDLKVIDRVFVRSPTKKY